MKGLGKLNLYLLTADLAAVGAVSKPTVEETGSMIAKLATGAMRGLYLLELVDSPKTAPEDAVIAACKDLYQYTMEELTEEEVTAMGFDTIVLEHALCKLTRLQTAYPNTFRRKCDATG